MGSLQLPHHLVSLLVLVILHAVVAIVGVLVAAPETTATIYLYVYPTRPPLNDATKLRLT